MTPQSVLVVVGLWVAGGPGLTVSPPGTAVGAGASDGAMDGEAAATVVDEGDAGDGPTDAGVEPQAVAVSAMARATTASPVRRRGSRVGGMAGSS